MKRLFLVLFMTTFALQVSAQNVSLYDGMYSQEWQEERDALLREEEQRNAERQRRLQESRPDTTGLHNKLLNAMRAQEQKAQQQNAAAQQRAAQQRAAHNKQVAIRNAQIKQQKKIRQQQLAQQRRQQQIEAERERQEQARIKAEQERIKREETRQRVTAETYQSLEHQTRTLQEAAAFASGYGAERMRAEQDVSRYESQVLQGTGNAVSQMDHLPRQKFEMPQTSLVLDPNKIYHLATWGDDVVPYDQYGKMSPSPIYYPPTPVEVGEWSNDQKKSLLTKFAEDMVSSESSLWEKGAKFDKQFNDQLTSASIEELEQMEKEWESIEKYAYLAKDTYKDGNGVLPQGYERVSEADKETLSPMEKELQNAIKDVNSNIVGFNCELYKTDEGNYVLSFRGTELDLDRIDQTKGMALIPFAKDAYADLRGALITEANGNPAQWEPQAMYARGISTQVTDILNKYNTTVNKNGERPSVACTGHSLGGRLAQEAALENGLQAIVFNSADLSSQTKDNIKKNNINTNNIKSVVSSTDPLTKYQRTNTGKTLIGEGVLKNEYVLSPKASEGGHSMGNISNEAADRRLAILREIHRRKN